MFPPDFVDVTEHFEGFQPNVIIQTERSFPSRIFVAALIGVVRILGHLVIRSIEQILANSLAFGRPVGFLISYSPKLALRYDLNSNVTEVLNEAVTLGYAYTSMGLSFG